MATAIPPLVPADSAAPAAKPNILKRLWSTPRSRYVIKRVITFFVIVWAGATLNFLLPHLVPGRNPVRERLGALMATGGTFQEGINEMVEAYEREFGLDKPLWEQYLLNLKNTLTFDFGYSLQNYPATVGGLIADALPWTLGLLTVATLLSFVVGTLAGALLGWPRSHPALQYLFAPFLTLSAVPYYLLGLVLIYFLAFRTHWFPLNGGYSLGMQPEASWEFAKNVLHHAILPALSIVLAQMGTWALGMRAMMVSVQGEDFMTLAEAKGLNARTVFFRYALRNAILPQTTSLALSLGTIVSQSILVEVVFGYPGIGTLLYKAISGFDYFLIYGIVFIVILGIALATLILDLIYPLLDPRITYLRS
jgi:peptide/nickel transport system permease protein